MADIARHERDWLATHMSPDALAFVLDGALDSVMAGEHCENITVEISARRVHEPVEGAPFHYGWRMRVEAYSESEHSDSELLDRGVITQAVFNERQARREEER